MTDFKNNITRLLRGEEGEVLTEYKDHLGYSTIGVGRLIDKRKGGGITAEESAYLLGNDIQKRMTELERKLPWITSLDEARRGVLLSMAFQMGVDGLLGFKNTLEMVRTGLDLRISRMQSAKCCAPPSVKSSRSTDVITTYLRAKFFTVSAKCCGSFTSNTFGRPCATSQKGQRRVQISPIIMKVAVPLPKHCGKLGHAASSQTVCNFC